MNLQQAEVKELAQSRVNGSKNRSVETDKNGKLIVRDADGEIVQDDMMAKDIAAGNVLEAPKVEEPELSVVKGENRWQHSHTIPDWLK
jgi:hypothetical protein